MSPGLPVSLTRHLADAEVEVVSWSGDSGALVLRVQKEVGPEVGLLGFGGVGHVSLAPRFTLAGIVRSEEAVGRAEPGPGESVFVFEEAWGASYFIVAESVHYEVLAG